MNSPAGNEALRHSFATHLLQGGTMSPLDGLIREAPAAWKMALAGHRDDITRHSREWRFGLFRPVRAEGQKVHILLPCNIWI